MCKDEGIFFLGRGSVVEMKYAVYRNPEFALFGNPGAPFRTGSDHVAPSRKCPWCNWLWVVMGVCALGSGNSGKINWLYPGLASYVLPR